MKMEQAAITADPQSHAPQGTGVEPRRGRRSWWLVVWAVLAALFLGMAAQHLDVPGPYYDEVVQAGPARDFLEGQAVAHLPCSEVLWVLGRPFPIRTTEYMGALKSQVLVPSFALFGTNLDVLRLSTIVWSLLGLGFALYWAESTLGLGACILAGLLLVLDPTFVFISRHDWGSFSLAFLCRCAGLALITLGWRQNRRVAFAFGGLALGLGLYNKVDFGVFFLAAGAGVFAAKGAGLLSALQRRRREVAVGLGALVLGALPALLHPAALLQRADKLGLLCTFKAKLVSTWFVLDGSYFGRLISSGGAFRRISESSEIPGDLFGFAVLISLLMLVILLARRFHAITQFPAKTFVLVTGLSAWLAILAIPGACRPHHIMNIYPFPQLIVALALMGIGSSAPGALRMARARKVMAIAAAALLLLSQARTMAHTFQILDRTGGRGVWSDAIISMIAEVEQQPDTIAVCLSWGLHEQFMFLGDSQRAIEPTWQMLKMRRARRTWRMDGNSRFIYLFFDKPFDLFRFGSRMLEAVKEVPPDAVFIRRHTNREGDPVFLSVRFNRPHQIFYDGDFRLRIL